MLLDVDESSFVSPDSNPPWPSPWARVWFQFKGVDPLIHLGDSEYEPVALVDPVQAARTGLRLVRSAGVSSYVFDDLDEGKGRLLIRKENGTVLVHAPIIGFEPTARVRYKDLLETWERFAKRVRSLERKLTPESANPNSRIWLESPNRRRAASWAARIEGIEDPVEPFPPRFHESAYLRHRVSGAHHCRRDLMATRS